MPAGLALVGPDWDASPEFLQGILRPRRHVMRAIAATKAQQRGARQARQVDGSSEIDLDDVGQDPGFEDASSLADPEACRQEHMYALQRAQLGFAPFARRSIGDKSMAEDYEPYTLEQGCKRPEDEGVVLWSACVGIRSEEGSEAFVEQV